jgi:hypothetical protein
VAENERLKIPCKAGELIITDASVRVESSQPRFGWVAARSEVAGVSSRKTPLGLLRGYDQELIVQTRDGRVLRADWLTSDQVRRVAALLSEDRAGAHGTVPTAAPGMVDPPVEIVGAADVLSIAPDFVRLTGQREWTLPRSVITGASSQTGALASDLMVHTQDGGEWPAAGMPLAGAVRVIEALGYVPPKHPVQRAVPVNIFCREGVLVVSDDQVRLTGPSERTLRRAEIGTVSCHLESPTRTNLVITTRDGRMLQVSAVAPGNALRALELLGIAPDADPTEVTAPAPVPAIPATARAEPGAAEVVPAEPVRPGAPSPATPMEAAAQLPTPAQAAITQPLRTRRPRGPLPAAPSPLAAAGHPGSAPVTVPQTSVPAPVAPTQPEPAAEPEATSAPAPDAALEPPEPDALAVLEPAAVPGAAAVPEPPETDALAVLEPAALPEPAAAAREVTQGPVRPRRSYRLAWRPVAVVAAVLVTLAVLYAGMMAALGGGGHMAIPARTAAPVTHATPAPGRTAAPVTHAAPAPTRTFTPLPVHAAVELAFTCASAVDNTAGRICVQTQPGAALTISISYCSGFSQPDPSSSLQGTVYADNNGAYVWRWTPQTTCHGSALAYVTAQWHGQMGYYSYTFTVQ